MRPNWGFDVTCHTPGLLGRETTVMPGLIICNSREECLKRTPCDHAASGVINSSDNLSKFAARTLTCIIMTANVITLEKRNEKSDLDQDSMTASHAVTVTVTA